MSIDLNPFNFIRKHILQICVRKVVVHLQKVLEVMSTDLNPFNFIRKHSLQICVRKVAVHLYKVMSTSVDTNTNTDTKSTYRSLSEQRLSQMHWT
jgi:hypothetical protein